MTEATAALLRELASSHRLEEEQYAQLVRGFDQEAAALAAPAGGGGPAAPLRGQGVHPGAHRDRQRVPQRLPLLRHPPLQPTLQPLPADGGADPRLLPGGLGAGLSHLCAPGGRGPAGGTGLRPGAGHQRGVPRLRRHPVFGGSTPQRTTGP